MHTAVSILIADLPSHITEPICHPGLTSAVVTSPGPGLLTVVLLKSSVASVGITMVNLLSELKNLRVSTPGRGLSISAQLTNKNIDVLLKVIKM